MIRCMMYILIVALFGCAMKGGNSYELRFGLPEGVPYEQVMSMEMQMEQPVMGQVMSMNQNLSFTYRYEVISDSAAWKTVKATITRVAVHMKGMGEDLRFDTDSSQGADANHPIAQVFGSMKGTAFTFTINRQGEVGVVDGVSQMRDRMALALTDSSLSPEPTQLENIRQNIQQSFSAYPPHPVNVGDNWSQERTVNMQGMEIVSKSKFALENVKDSVAFIRVSSDLASNKAQNKDQNISQLKGRADGLMQYHVVTGMPVEGELTTNIELQLKSDGESVPMKMKMITRISGSRL